MANVNLHRGDDTDSFDGGLFMIDYTTNSGYNIKKLEIQMGNITKTYTNPTFPLQVNLRSSESAINSAGKYDINLVILDENYRRLNIATGSTITFCEPGASVLLPYESITLFDLSEVLPKKTSDNTDDTQTSTDEPQTGTDEPQGDDTEPQSGDENNQNNDDTNPDDNTQTGDNPEQIDEPTNP